MSAGWEEWRRLAWVAHFAATWALVGLIWVVHRAIYPRFGPRPDFATDHARYTRAIGGVVAPLMLIELITAGLLLALGWRPAAFLLTLAPLAVNWASTAFVQVPLHRKLAGGYDDDAARRLVSTNRIRVAAWSLRGVGLMFTWPGASA